MNVIALFINFCSPYLLAPIVDWPQLPGLSRNMFGRDKLNRRISGGLTHE